MTPLDELEAALQTAALNPHLPAEAVVGLVAAAQDLTAGIEAAGDLAQGERIVRAALALYERHYPQRKSAHAAMRGYLACLIYYQGRARVARPLLLEARAAAKAAGGAPDDTVIYALSVMAAEDGRWREALDFLREGRNASPASEIWPRMEANIQRLRGGFMGSVDAGGRLRHA